MHTYLKATLMHKKISQDRILDAFVLYYGVLLLSCKFILFLVSLNVRNSILGNVEVGRSC